MKIVPFDGSDIAGKVMKTATFTTSGTWIKPDGVEFVLVTMCGGGASGAASAASGGNGGGAGKVVFDQFLAVPDSSYYITVGSGGASVTKPSGQTGVAGNAGGVSSFGSLLSCSGGSISGGEGAIVVVTNLVNCYKAGKGQDCPSLGIGGGTSTGPTSSTGYLGLGYGSGGGGGVVDSSANTISSGAGAPGIVIVKWFE